MSCAHDWLHDVEGVGAGRQAGGGERNLRVMNASEGGATISSDTTLIPSRRPRSVGDKRMASDSSSWTRHVPLLSGGFALTVYLGWRWLEATRVKVVNAGEAGSKYANLIKQCKSAERYWPSVLGIHSALELVPFIWIGSRKTNRLSFTAEDVVMDDGEAVQLCWYKCSTRTGPSGGIPSFDSDSEVPIVMLHHGLLCGASDLPGQGYIKQGLSKGWYVCALNRRGHVSRRPPLTQPKFHIFGSTSDVRAVVEHIRGTKRPAAPLYMVGLSSGSGLVASVIGEQGESLMKDSHPSFVNGVVGVAPGYNIEKCMSRIKFPYHQVLLERAKAFFLGRNQTLLHQLPGFKEMNEAKCLQTFLDESYPFGGYASKEEMYLKINPMRTIVHVRDPALFINAENDPICVLENIEEHIHLFQVNKGATLLLTKMGSHLPFHEFSFNPLRFECWAERVAFEFLEAAEGHRQASPSTSCPVSASPSPDPRGRPGAEEGQSNFDASSPSSPLNSALNFSSPGDGDNNDVSPWSTVKSPQARER